MGSPKQGVILVGEVEVVPEAVGDEDAADGDVIGQFLDAVAAGDVDAVMVTPLSSSMVIRGHDDLRVVFAALLPQLSQHLHWRVRVGNGETTVAVAVARLGGVRVEDAMLLEHDVDGRIRRVTPHVRPWLGLTLSAFVLGPKLMRHPGIIRRALSSRAGSDGGSHSPRG
jgi:ketosteroid isomerase-like protein